MRRSLEKGESRRAQTHPAFCPRDDVRQNGSKGVAVIYRVRRPKATLPPIKVSRARPDAKVHRAVGRVVVCPTRGTPQRAIVVRKQRARGNGAAGPVKQAASSTAHPGTSSAPTTGWPEAGGTPRPSWRDFLVLCLLASQEKKSCFIR